MLDSVYFFQIEIFVCFFTNCGARHLHTSFAGDQPLLWFGVLRGAHIVLCVDPELVFSARHYVAECESVVEDAICNGVPRAFTRVALSHHVVQPVVTFLIRRWGPWNSHCARHVFVSLYGTRRLRLILSCRCKLLHFCPQNMEKVEMIYSVRKYSLFVELTSDSYFNAEWFLGDNVLDNYGIDSSIWALGGRNQQLGCSLCIADGHLFRHWRSIFQPDDLGPRRCLQKIRKYNFWVEDVIALLYIHYDGYSS